MFTVVFAITRIVGWIAQLKKRIDERPEIGRPPQLSTSTTRFDGPRKFGR